MGRLDSIELVDEDGRFHVPLPKFVELGERILDLFMELRSRYTHGKTRVSKKAYVQFYKAAILCEEQGLAPEQFVEQQLNGMARIGKFWPSAIASPKFAALAPDPNILWVRMIRHYKSQLKMFSDRSMIYGPRLTLEDGTNQFTPLFRAVMANEYGFHDIVREHFGAAQHELVTVPVAREVFGNLVGFLDV